MRNPGHLPMPARRSDLRVAYLLTVLAAITMASSSAGGVLATDWLYRDNDLITATFRGQDMVTLVVAVPLLLLGLILEVRGSPRGRMLWLGMLFYTMYAYLFYAVAAAFNQFFLLYVASFGLPLYALLLSVTRLDLRRLGEGMGGTAARAVAIAYTSAVAAGLGILWSGMSLSYLATGEVPQPILDSGHPTGVVFVIDLVLIVPPMLLAAAWLARRRASGWVLAGVMSVGGTVYTLTLAAASVEVARQGMGSGDELPLWAGLTVLGAATALLLFRCMPRSGATPAREGEDADDRQGDAGHGRRRSARLVGRDA